MNCKEYETKSGNPIRLWQGDCMELMAKDKEWDLGIIDVPYGINEGSEKIKSRHHSQSKYKTSDWDIDSPKVTYFGQLFSVSDNQIIWGANHFISKIAKDSSCWIVWDKDTKQCDFADAELAWTSFDTAVKIYEHTWNGFRQKIKQDRIHPTEKPIQLYRWLLTNYATEGDTILDTHGGSMSLAIACYIEDYELDIIELDEDYYNDAVERFEQHISQQVLF